MTNINNTELNSETHWDVDDNNRIRNSYKINPYDMDKRFFMRCTAKINNHQSSCNNMVKRSRIFEIVIKAYE